MTMRLGMISTMLPHLSEATLWMLPLSQSLRECPSAPHDCLRNLQLLQRKVAVPSESRHHLMNLLTKPLKTLLCTQVCLLVSPFLTVTRSRAQLVCLLSFRTMLVHRCIVLLLFASSPGTSTIGLKLGATRVLSATPVVPTPADPATLPTATLLSGSARRIAAPVTADKPSIAAPSAHTHAAGQHSGYGRVTVAEPASTHEYNPTVPVTVDSVRV
jgi:hypothetical protein